MKTDREKSIVMMMKTISGFIPVSAFDAEIVSQVPLHKHVEVEIKQRRSIPQMRRYWVMLGDVVKATECYPTAEHLHDVLKFEMGYVTPVKRLNGDIVLVPDSTAFSKMGPDEFKGFFDRAVRLISETYGFDPLGLEAYAA